MYPDEYLNKEDDEAVYWFSSPYDPLNNWSAHVVNAWGLEFHTLEHAYHYKKFADDNPEIAENVKNTPSPWAAMKISREFSDKVRKDWDIIKSDVMAELVRLKLDQNVDVQEVLAKTKGRRIVENSHIDNYWGAGLDGTGENMMGKIWMKIRDENK